MMSTSSCTSTHIVDDSVQLFNSGDSRNKFTQPLIDVYINSVSLSNKDQIRSIPGCSSHSQTYKNFLAQKYAAESTSTDGDVESRSDSLPSHSLSNHQSQSFHQNTISGFYPFSPLVSSSNNSSFDPRNILAGSSVLESSIDSLQVESSTKEISSEINSNSSNHHSIYNHDDLRQQPSIIVDNTYNIKPELITAVNRSGVTTSTTNVTSSSSHQHGTNLVTESSLSPLVEVVSNNSIFEDLTVDSTTVNNHSISQVDMNSTLPSLLTFNNNFPQTSNHSTSLTNQILTSAYSLSPNYSNTILHIEHSPQLIPSLASPSSLPLDQYFDTQIEKKVDTAGKTVMIIDHQQQQQQHHLLPSVIHSSYSNETNHLNLIIAANTPDILSEHDDTNNIFQDIQDENFNHNDLQGLNETVINDLPVLTRARATLPIDYLYLQQIVDGSIGTFSRKHISKRTQFGPLEGVVVALSDNHYSINDLAFNSKNSLIVFISETLVFSQIDENSSNWTRFVRPAINANEQNLELCSKECNENELKYYFYATRPIMPDEELKVWYSEHYAQKFNIKLLDDPCQSINLNDSDQGKSLFDDNNNKSLTTTGHKLRNKIAKSQQAISQPQNFLKSIKLDEKNHQNSLNNVIDHSNKSESHLNQIVQDKFKKYKCDVCQKTFPRHYSLRRHQVMHSGEKRYKCPICNLAFNHVYNRNRHIKMHKTYQSDENSSRQLKKEKTNKLISNVMRTELNPSTETIDQSKNENCDLVKNVSHTVLNDSSTIQNLIDISNEQTNKNVSSNDKQKTISNDLSEFLLKKNQLKLSHSSLSSFNNVSHSDDFSNNHVTSSNFNSENNFISSTLGQKLTQKLFRCTQCYKRFSTRERLERHGVVHDESAKKFSCQICGRKFLTNSALACHVKYHKLSGNEPRKYDCALCDQVFETIQLRREHVSVHLNTETALFHCPKCPKTFEDFSIIRKHLKSFHSNEVFPCTHCTKVFPRQDKLRLHMLCHIDHWEFKCNFCEKQFKRKDKLKEHTQRMHAPDRDVRIAAKMAARMQRLKVQRTKKVATKPSQPNYHEYIYKCHQCLFGFKRRGMLVNHLAKRHPDIPYNSVPELNMPIVKTSKDYYCQYCNKVYKSSSKRKAHIIKNHPGKSLPPSNRNKTITSEVTSSTFSATVGSITINPHFCNWCHKQYASKAKLMQHQRKKHAENLQNFVATNQKNKSFSNATSNGGVTSTTSVPSTTSMYKLNTIISGDKATFTTIPITSDMIIKNESDNHSQIIQIDAPPPTVQPTPPLIKEESSYIVSENDSPQSFADSFSLSSHFSKNNVYLSGNMISQSQVNQVFSLDSNDPTFEEFLNLEVSNHNLNLISTNSTSSNSPFANNVITILGSTFSNDLNEFSDIITHIDFQNSKTILNSTNSSTVVENETEQSDLMISDAIENNWNQVCEEIAMV